MKLFKVWVPSLLAILGALGGVVPQANAALLIGNTSANNIVAFDEISGKYLGEFISPSSGLESPDTFIYGPDGNLYVSSGKTPETSAIFRFNRETGKLIDKFATGGGLFRPYGIAFGPDNNLYVSSFLSDQILRYDGTTGAFLDVFATGDGTDPKGLNGPNGLLFGPDGQLYVTTQGSVAIDGKADFSKGFPSLILKYDITTGQRSLFADQPTPSPDSFGFVSFLGLAVGPGDGDLYVSDFANDIRRYDFTTGLLKEVLSTNYSGTVPSGNFIGSLAFGPTGDLFTVGFDIDTLAGSVLKYEAGTKARSVFVDNSDRLQRPIGLLYTPVQVPEPGAIAALAVIPIGAFALRKRQSEA